MLSLTFQSKHETLKANYNCIAQNMHSEFPFSAQFWNLKCHDIPMLQKQNIDGSVKRKDKIIMVIKTHFQIVRQCETKQVSTVC